MWAWTCVFVTALSLACPSQLRAQSADNVLLIVNDRSDVSREIGTYYQHKRRVAPDHIVHLSTSTDETIDRDEFVNAIEQPVIKHLAAARLQDRVLYIVLTKGIPLRIRGTQGLTGTVASVDSELTLTYRRMVGSVVAVDGRIDNPYFLGARPIKEARPFSHRDHDIYLVSRLDGFTVRDIVGLIDRGSVTTKEGRVVLDRQDSVSTRAGESWLQAAAGQLAEVDPNSSVVLETTAAPAKGLSDVIGYYSWGSNDPHNRERRTGMRFVPGAVAAMFVSTDARTFEEPPENWSPSADWNSPAALFARSPQSLTGDLIREGVTGVAGHVAEPYLQSTIRPEVLFPAYFSGFNLVESFYLAMPHVGWQTVVIGDPLVNPFPRRSTSSEDLVGFMDAETSLPAFLARRRLARASSELNLETASVVTSMVRAHAMLERGDIDGSIAALDQAVTASPGLTGAQLQLAILNERVGRVDAAAKGYERVLTGDAANAIALNNLAYLTATQLGKPAAALPLALRAADVTRRHPLVLDTLGWIQHLLGENAAAEQTLRDAAGAAPSVALIRLHLAVVSAAAGFRAVAENELAEALRLDVTLESAELVKALRNQLRPSTAPR